jgi:hypothetical protein
MEGLRKFLLEIKGKNLNDISEVDLAYYKLFNQFLSEPGEGKFSGLAPVSSFVGLEKNNANISYEVTADILRYPKLEDYAEKLKFAFNNTIKKRIASYSISKTSGENQMDVITLKLEFAYKSSDLDKDINKASVNIGKQLIEAYRFALATNNKELKKQIESQYPDILQQNVSITPTKSTAEEELKQKALQTDKEPETSTDKRPKKPTEPPKQLQTTINQPIIMSPGEKLTISKEKESKSEKTVSKEKESKSDKSLIESISNSVFDRRIMDYKDTLIRSETERSSPIQSSPIVPTQPIYNAGQSGDKSLKQEITKTKEGSSVSNVMESILGPNVALLPIQISQNVPIIPRVSMTSENVSDLETRVNQTGERETVKSSDVISSVNNSIKQVQGSIGLLSNIIKEGENSTKNNVNNVISESLSFLDLVPSNVTKSIEKLNQAVEKTISTEKEDKGEKTISKEKENKTVESEKTTAQNSSLQSMTNKVVGIDVVSPLKNEMTSIIENMGNSVRNAVTMAIMQDKRTTEERSVSVQSAAPKPSTSTSIVNEGQRSETQLQAPNLQNFMSEGGAPTVVSLSQSTIDNLASAIIKNMSISPFLNSGRV